MKQTLVSTSIFLILFGLIVSLGNVNCSDENNISSKSDELDKFPKRKPSMIPDGNTPLNTFIPNPNYYTLLREEDCKMEICFCCEEKGRYYEMYDVNGGPIAGHWTSDGSRCLSNLVNTYKGHSYVVYEFNVNCPADENPPTYFTACTCDYNKDSDTLRCCQESK